MAFLCPSQLAIKRKGEYFETTEAFVVLPAFPLCQNPWLLLSAIYHDSEFAESFRHACLFEQSYKERNHCLPTSTHYPSNHSRTAQRHKQNLC